MYVYVYVYVHVYVCESESVSLWVCGVVCMYRVVGVFVYASECVSV